MEESQKALNLLIQDLQTNTQTGLPDEQVLKRLEKYGENILREDKKDSWLKKFLHQLSDKMVIVLIIASAISALNSFFSNESLIDSFIIIGIVILNALFGVIQESKAENAIKELSSMSAPVIRTLRSGSIKNVSSRHIVPGDIIYLEYGTVVPADCRIISSTELLVDEAVLTGESTEVAKYFSERCDSTHITEMHNTLFAGSSIKGGHAKALVVKTGMNTYVGNIAELLGEGITETTPLQKRLSKSGSTIGNCALATCALIFLIGVIRHQPAREMFMTSVSLAVAAIPEGLPAIITLILSIGVRNMALRGAIIRRMSAVEALGGVSVICTDKTGTLTENKMSVDEVWGDRLLMKKYGGLCNNNVNPTDKAIHDWCDEEYKLTRIKEIPFTSERKLMTVVVKEKNKYITVTKGAPDVVEMLCGSVPFAYKKMITEMSSNALRVIALAYAITDSVPDFPENKLIFCGLFGIADPIRTGVYEAVMECSKAGIRTVMITGDHISTACVIAKKAGIYNGICTTEKELNELSSAERERKILSCSVFARTSPAFKNEIVKVLRAHGETVAMTGDGVNDAPALKKLI
ncbi:MAG TPA: HAD-IC family P-type ATPase [Bacillota bacterium]|nr:HAD-IC family P-type ATPase [Bacillota bacterium]